MLRVEQGIGLFTILLFSALNAAPLGAQVDPPAIETSGDAARASLGWTVEPTPDLRIGVAEGAEPYQLHQVRGVAQLADGRIVIANNGSRELRYFDYDGVFVQAVGGRGQGPGEYGSLQLFPSFAGDSLFVFDMRGRRFTVLTDEGEVVRTFPLLPPHQYFRPVGTADGHILMQFRPSLLFAAGGGPGHKPWPEIYGVFDSEAQVVDTIAHFAHTRVWRRRDNGPNYALPLTVPAEAAVGPDGFFVTDGTAPEITYHGLDGAVRGILRVDEPLPAVTPELWERAIERTAGGTTPEVRARVGDLLLENMTPPETVPVFESLLVDRAGWLWAERYRVPGAEARVWIVFDPEGRARGSVQMPSELNEVEILEIGDDYVLGVWQDDLDVEYVHRYSLRGR